jgi:hypothetical protein
MVPLRRSGVLVERCSDCAGVFLDRGELEKIIALEQQAEQRWTDEDAGSDDYGEYTERGTGRRPQSRKRRFFEELFDID